jgi:hypothetical protein
LSEDTSVDLDEVGNLVSHQDIRDSVFQNSIIKESYLGMLLTMPIIQRSGTDNQADVPENLISSTFEEGLNFLLEDGK